MAFEKNFGDSVHEVEAHAVGYRAGTPGDWTTEPHDVEDALDNLAAAARRTVAKMLYAEDPLLGDEYPIGWVAYPVTFLQVRGITDVGTATFNIERRVITTPATVGTDILTDDLVAAVGGAVTVAFAASGAVAADQWLVATITSVATAPTKLWIPYKFSID